MSASHILHRGRSVFSKLNKKYRLPAATTTTSESTSSSASSICSYSTPSSSDTTLSSSTDTTIPTTNAQQQQQEQDPQEAAKAQQFFELGQQLLFGRYGHSKDEAAAVEYYRMAAQLGSGGGHLEAQAALAFCYEFGLGIQADFVEAERLYILAAERNNGLALSRLAFLRKYGRPSVKIDRIESEYWQQKINQQGPAALAWLMEAASVDNHDCCQYALGVCYHDGVGVEKNPTEAFHWYLKSAEQGNARGQGILGYCYGEGFGVERDRQKAMYWYGIAAEQGDSVALYNIGYCYEDGLGVERNPEEAVKWYRLSAELGNAFAQNSLGYCYEDGVGIEQNLELAAEWYTKSAEQGYPWAECNLGYCNQNGIGLPKDNAKGAY
ncbi:hypothetical protein BGW39_007866, partial [Mortierella sp. 14UC]